MKNFMLMTIAVMLFILIAPIAFIIGLLVYKLSNYFYVIAIGIDQLGGSILYKQPDWTVSSWTWIKVKNNSKFHKYVMVIIDFFFGKDHCKRAYNEEMEIHNNLARDIKHAVN